MALVAKGTWTERDAERLEELMDIPERRRTVAQNLEIEALFYKLDGYLTEQDCKNYAEY
jgi:hypothetical protein